MMKKCWFSLVLLLVLPVHLSAQKTTSPVADIGIVGDIHMRGPRPPAKLNLGLEMVRDAYYKFSYNADIIGAGHLKRGFNVIPIVTDSFFQSSGAHVFVLEMLAGGQVSRKEIHIDVSLDFEEESSGSESAQAVPVSVREFSLSLYIEDKLIAYQQMNIPQTLSFSIDLPPFPINYDSFDPEWSRRPERNTVSILDAVSAITKMAQDALKREPEKSRPVGPLQLRKQITASYRRRAASGLEQDVQATITLSYKETE